MADNDAGERKGRAEELRREIDGLDQQPDEQSADDDHPREGESLREFVERRMHEKELEEPEQPA